MPILPDLLRPGLDVVFCGSRPGKESAEKQCYYARRGNKFWSIVYKIGLTPRLLAPSEFPLVNQFGIGLTDLGKDSFGQDHGWKPTLADAARLRRDIEKSGPQVLAFTSKNSAQWFLGRKVEYGKQAERIGSTLLFALPSTSGLNGHWNETHWRELGDFILRLREQNRG